MSPNAIVAIFKENRGNLNNEIIIDGEPKRGHIIVEINADEITTIKKTSKDVVVSIYRRNDAKIVSFNITKDIIHKML